MFDILLKFSRIASIATIITAATAMSATTSRKDIAQTSIEVLTRQYSWTFAVYIGLLALLVIATFVNWRSGNRLQDAIRADADARIAEAGTAAAEAVKSAAQANERIKTLDIQLAQQQTRAAMAERSLLELRERLKPRSFSSKERSELIKSLKTFTSKVPISITCNAGDAEACNFGDQIRAIFAESGWPVAANETQVVYPPPLTIGLLVSGHKVDEPYGTGILSALGKEVGNPKALPDRVNIFVGAKR